MKSPIQLELTSGIFFMASAEALMTKSFTDSLKSPLARAFNSWRSLEGRGGEEQGKGRGGEGRGGEGRGGNTY